MAEKQKLSSYVPTITESIALRAGLNASDVGITCTTLEGLGFVGREEGICVHSTVSIVKAE
jgi:2C-methyl-D-erythritol 2,4-cyclodiphosphate synthase